MGDKENSRLIRAIDKNTAAVERLARAQETANGFEKTKMSEARLAKLEQQQRDQEAIQRQAELERIGFEALEGYKDT